MTQTLRISAYSGKYLLAVETRRLQTDDPTEIKLALYDTETAAEAARRDAGVIMRTAGNDAARAKIWGDEAAKRIIAALLARTQDDARKNPLTWR